MCVGRTFVVGDHWSCLVVAMNSRRGMRASQRKRHQYDNKKKTQKCLELSDYDAFSNHVACVKEA